MTTFTTAELATRAQKEYGLYGLEETPSAADQEWAEQTVRSEILVLLAKEIPIWDGGTTSVPEDYLTVLARRVGAPIAHSNGLMDTATLLQVMEATEHDLRILGMTPASGDPQTAEYF